jgi:thioredoxin type arsenate reductase
MIDSLSPPEFLELLGHSLRWELVKLLIESDRRVHELVEMLQKPQNLVSYHLHKLSVSGLVRERRSSLDSREVYYSLDLGRLRYYYQASGEALHPSLAPQVIEPAPGHIALSPLKVLFICTFNSARSQMAEGLLRQKSGGALQVFSAGTHPTGINPYALRVMAEISVDISGQRSKALDEFVEQELDYLITVCDIAREECPVFPGRPHYKHWSLADPASIEGDDHARLAAFRQTLAELNTRIDFLLYESARKNF